MAADFTLVAGALSLVFERAGDRFRHCVYVAGEPVLESIEGSPADDWPPSPPLQELHAESPALALLVGMAGSSHWSLSAHSGGELSIDVACRTKASPAGLASAYRVVGPTNGLTIEPDATGPSACTIERGESRITLVPAQIVETYPATVRWRYVFRLS